MSFHPPNSRASAPAPKYRIYFAYGSNLHLNQMAQRCPKSRYLGRAILHGYRWQINDRGYANVVRVPHASQVSSSVQGLCYLINREDEAKLDRNEGVPTAYGKTMLDVELFVGRAGIAGRDVGEVVGCSVEEVRSAPLLSLAQRGEIIPALVYVSLNHTLDGRAKEEYVHRMRLGLSDAFDLGLSPDYVQWLERVINAGVRQNSGTGGQRKPEVRYQKRVPQRGRRRGGHQTPGLQHGGANFAGRGHLH
ncbi:gamma-glutamylcyclotransferase family protein [Aspergillus puulaauensis]|uniref:gamma-glutamylcyclotransferase n=1 Tax=Aspergillus puulaauensis TaxID=1220207 RepID=A0A7R7XH17_9EURO|nr:uncharacterized protein APUU_21629A [Aspergillus puulaauensis]BCS21197.1 hypothetical protein APUU_21629A [Aspergillus puulaauensis]